MPTSASAIIIRQSDNKITHKVRAVDKRVRAIIIRNDKILLIKRIKPNLVYWIIPGGAVENYETDKEALIRECREELGIDVRVNKLLLEMNSKKPGHKDQREFFYLCKIISGKIGSGHGPEFEKNSSYVGKYEIEWKNIKKLEEIDLMPKEIKEIIISKFS